MNARRVVIKKKLFEGDERRRFRAESAKHVRDVRDRYERFAAMPVKRDATLADCSSNRYRIKTIAPEVYERDDVVVTHSFCRGWAAESSAVRSDCANAGV